MRVLVYDLETGGLDPHSCGITEIGAVTGDVLTGQICGRYQSYVKPEPTLLYNESALAVQGKSLDFLESNGRPIRTVFNELTSFVFDHIGAPISATAYAWKAAFDRDFMISHTKRLGLKYAPVPYSTICAMEAFKHGQRFHGLPKTTNAKLASACRAFGLPFDDSEAHAADYDAEMTFLALHHIIRGMKEAA